MNKYTRTIKFKKGRKSPRFSDTLWIKKQVLLSKKEIRVTVLFDKDSKYKVVPASDQADWMKICGTMTFWNIFSKSKEELGAFRYLQEAFSVANYQRNESTGGNHRAYNVKVGNKLTLEIPKKYIIPVGAWAGGTGKLLNDFSITLTFER